MGDDQRGRVSGMDADSFGGKVLLNVIDKLILGLAAGIVLFLFQQCERAKDEAFQERLTISQVETKIIADAITTANKHMLDYLTIAEPAVQGKQQLTTDQSTQVASLRDQLRLTLLIVQEMASTPDTSKAVSDAATALLSAMAILNRALRIPAPPDDAPSATERQEQLDGVNKAYRASLVALRQAAVAAAETTRTEAAQ